MNPASSTVCQHLAKRFQMLEFERVPNLSTVGHPLTLSGFVVRGFVELRGRLMVSKKEGKGLKRVVKESWKGKPSVLYKLAHSLCFSEDTPISLG